MLGLTILVVGTGSAGGSGGGGVGGPSIGIVRAGGSTATIYSGSITPAAAASGGSPNGPAGLSQAVY